jgi:hypothetical protein
MCQRNRPALQVNEADSHRQLVLEPCQMTMEQRRCRNQAPGCGLESPIQLDREAAMTRITRRILDSAALSALLQFKPPRRRGLGQAQGGAAMQLQGWLLHNTNLDRS